MAGVTEECILCDRDRLRELAEVYVENEWCVYASTRDPRDPPDVLPGCGIIVTKAHKVSPFDFDADEWVATHELLLAAKSAWDERLAPDGYTLIWNCGPSGGQEVPHAHLHVIRFDDEPHRGCWRALCDQGCREPQARSVGAGARPRSRAGTGIAVARLATTAWTGMPPQTSGTCVRRRSGGRAVHRRKGRTERTGSRVTSLSSAGSRCRATARSGSTTTASGRSGAGLAAIPEPPLVSLRMVPRYLLLFPREFLRASRAMTCALAKVHPNEPHWYLMAVGVVPEAQGQGRGAAVLEPVLRRCDADQFRRTSKSTADNARLYERLGFESREEVEGASRGVRVRPMAQAAADQETSRAPSEPCRP